MSYKIDGLEIYYIDEDYSDNIEVIHHGVWNGPQNPEIEARRIQGLKDSWNNKVRREEQAERMRLTRPTMRQVKPHQNGITDQHRANMSKAQMGNSNARKKK